MKLTVLVDNNTLIDRYLYGEPGLSYYIEDEDVKLLLDTGYSDLFINNARQLHIDLSKLSAIVMSHGHIDHTEGLLHFSENYEMGAMKIIAHPDTFHDKVVDEMRIGSPVVEDELRSKCNVLLTAKPMQLSKHLMFLGEIPSSNDFEMRKAIGKKKLKGKYVDDYVQEDSALVYQTENGIYIITGCSHSGICNIIEYAKNVCNSNNVIGVIGGFHLFEQSIQLQKTVEYFIQNDIKELYPCHCVSFKAKAYINQFIPIHEVGVGMEIVW